MDLKAIHWVPVRGYLCWLVVFAFFQLRSQAVASDPVLTSITDEVDQFWIHDPNLVQTQVIPQLTPPRQFYPSRIGAPVRLDPSPSRSMFSEARISFGTFDFVRALQEYLRNRESDARISTDVGDFIHHSPHSLGASTSKRNPIITEERVRGIRVGALLGSGSHWVPARMDLDTLLSKIDSRVISETLITKGPYSVRYGPGFSFIEVAFADAPRFPIAQGMGGGSTSIEYETNGEQWFGRQQVYGGDENSGFRLTYGHRTGNDYSTGDGREIASSFKSRNLDFAYGIDLNQNSKLELHFLRLDQTDVEFPGQAFDINWLVTDGFDARFVTEPDRFADRIDFETWYNRTRFEGDNLRPGKRRQFPIYDSLAIDSQTDVDSMSVGYRSFLEWEFGPSTIALGSDFRLVAQELNEISSLDGGRSGGNSPIPESHQSNPGLFVDYSELLGDRASITAGARVDWISSNVDDSASKLADLGISSIIRTGLPLEDILGTSDFDRDHQLFGAFLAGEYLLNRDITLTLAGAYAERAPTLTELYAAQPFMYVLQNGLNTITGDPELREERRWQIDFGFEVNRENTRSGINTFAAWVHDFITYEVVSSFPPNSNSPSRQQIDLRFTNTDLATFAGLEWYVETELSSWLSFYATLAYLDGRDQTRNGDSATDGAVVGTSTPIQSVQGLPRGNFDQIPNVMGAAEEPLPGIQPLESRLGLTLHDPAPEQLWAIELSVRLTAAQNRVATSLLETTTPGYAIWDIRSFWRLTENWTTVLGVENLTDEEYRDHLDFRPSISAGQAFAMSQPGISFYFGSELAY